MKDAFARRLTRRRLIGRALNGVTLAALAGWASGCQPRWWVPPPQPPLGTPGEGDVGRATATIGSVRATATIQAGPLNRVWHVDATNGSDSNDGLSTSTPIKTIAKVNSLPLQAGDSVLFARGQNWSGTRLVIQVSGLPGRNITFGAYGSGAKPIIDGGTVFSPYAAGVDCVLLSGARSYVTIQDLELRNGNDFGISMATCDHINIIDCDIHDVGNDCVLIFTGSHDIAVTRGTYKNANNRTGTYVSSGIEVGDSSHDVTITDVECSGNSTCGIALHNHAATDPQGRTNFPQNVTITGANSHNNTGSGIQIMAHDVSDNPFDLTVRDSTFNLNGTYGINITKTSASTVYPNNITISGCTTEDNVNYPLQVAGGDSIQIDHCQIVEPTDIPVSIAGVTNFAFYHNTLYQRNNTAFQAILLISGAGLTGSIRNNLFIAPSTNSYMIATGSGATGIAVDYNLYDTAALTSSSRWKWNNTSYNFANWQLNSGQDAHSTAYVRSLTVNPPTDLTLQATSPAIDKGVVIAGVNDGTGGSTHYLGAAPDLGFAEKA